MSEQLKFQYRVAPYFHGDGLTLERSLDGATWESVGYINTGATASTVALAREIVDKLNHGGQ